MKDVAPELREEIEKEFNRAMAGDGKLQELMEKAKGGTITYAEADEAAKRIGGHSSDALKKVLTADTLPDGKMYYNIATRTVAPQLEDSYDIAAELAQQAQQILNEQAGIGLKAVKPTPDKSAVSDFVNKICSYDNAAYAEWMLEEPVKTFVEDAVTDTVRKNTEFQSNVGLSPKIHRYMTGKCCDWCRGLAGSYKADDAPKDIYRRHANCTCIVEYDAGDGKRTNVHTKKTYSEEDSRKHIADAREYNQKKAEQEEKARLERIETGAKKNVKLGPDESYEEHHAVMYYEEVRNRAPYSDAKRIAENVDGFDIETVEEIRKHMFITEQPRDGGLKRFNADYEQAEVWRRLVEGKEIRKTDVLLLQHEKLEMEIMKATGCTYEEAHEKANQKYNWWEEVQKGEKKK